MSFENPLQNQERPPISIDSISEKLKAYPKAMRAALLVAMLGVGTAHNTAEAQNEVTGGNAQSESSDAGVTLQGNEEETQTHEADEGTVVMPRNGWIIPPTTEGSSQIPTEDADNISIGEIYLDGKKITSD